jgi:Predicted phosphoesterase or phosphohydrolase
MMIPKLTFNDGGRLRFTADTHFGHSQQAKRRGFDDIDEHDNFLIHRWNAAVRKDDFVFHAGDFAHKCPPDRLERIFSRLNGRKFLILGNHDDQATAALPWAAPASHRFLLQIGSKDKQVQIVIDHYGGRTWYNSHHGVLQLYGHSHGGLPATKQSCDIGVDAWEEKAPITIWDALQRMKEATITLREVQDLIPGGPRCETRDDEEDEAEPTVPTI